MLLTMPGCSLCRAQRYSCIILMLIIAYPFDIIMADSTLPTYAHLILAMGTNTSKIKDILFVSSESLDSPDLHAKKQSRPHKEVQIDYKAFVPRNYYKEDATEQEIKAHLEALEKKENILKQFKHHRDFDRIDYKRMDDQILTFELLSEELIKMTIGIGLITSRVLAVQFAVDYFTVAGWRRMFWPAVLTMIPVGIFRALTGPEYHIINHEYFRMLPEQQALYLEYDQKYNLYKDVNDIKFNFKYRSLSDYYQTRRRVLENIQYAKKNWYKEYYLYEFGLKTEPFQEFANARVKERTGNWEILTESQRQQIQEELRLREAQSN